MIEQLTDTLDRYGQQHLVRFWDQLSAEAQRSLAEQIGSVDFALIEKLYREGAFHEDFSELARLAEPPPAVRLDAGHPRFSSAEARRVGGEALAASRVAAILVAGGQGTRLGMERPKGVYPIGPVSQASLFQIHFERVLAASRRWGAPVPVYLMTSPATHEETIAYLQAHDRFGLPEDQLFVFCQGTMPAVDAATGKLLLERTDQLVLSPDGHGGAVEALHRSGALESMSQRGIDQLFYFQVDNPLTPVCDPTLIGYHLLFQSDLLTLAVAKHSPQDRMGNVVTVDGKVRIIEYIDLPAEAAERQDADGSLALWAGSTAIHVIGVKFLERMATSDTGLPLHVSQKRVPYIDASGEQVEPSEPNALKFERFIFDLLPFAENSVVIEADRQRTFAPLKNASGAASDTPERVRAQMVALHREWLEAAGADVRGGAAVEISPLVASAAEELVGHITPGQVINTPTYFGPGATELE